MQAAISIIAWVLLKLWGSGVYYGSLAYWLYRQDYQAAYVNAEATRNEWTCKRNKITEGLIEFHKAQCFFMLAIQAASLIARHGPLLDRSNLQQIYNDSAFIEVLSVGGHLPISFVLYTIRTAGHKSWYLFLLSVCTVALSAAALLTTNYPAPNIVSTGYQYADCGDVNPTALCLETDFTIPTLKTETHGTNGVEDLPKSSNTYLASFIHHKGPQNMWIGASSASLTFSLVVLGILYLDYCNFQTILCRSTVSVSKRTSVWKIMMKYTFVQITKRIVTWLSQKARYLCSGFPSLVISIAYIVFFFYYLIDLNYFQHPTDYSASGYVPINLSQWTFGQIAAITIWIQPLFQYAYLEICKFILSYESVASCRG